MGACDFSKFSKGENAKAAFREAVEDARYEHGHGGYSGTIAEKSSFVIIGQAQTTQDAQDMAQKMIDEGDARIDDKWGPAGCIEILDSDLNRAPPRERKFLFFGWASE